MLSFESSLLNTVDDGDDDDVEGSSWAWPPRLPPLVVLGYQTFTTNGESSTNPSRGLPAVAIQPQQAISYLPPLVTFYDM